MGIVLCYPPGHEYYRVNRSYVKWADQLAQLGFPVMRFDYLGSGDSEGDAGHARLDGFLDEVAEVASELTHSEPVSRVALGGVRFGGTLAMLAAQRIDSARALILWDPVTDGTRYVEGLRRLHARMLKDLERFPHVRRRNECAEGELIGTRYEPGLLHEIAGITPGALSVDGIEDAVLLTTAGTAPEEALVRMNGGVRWQFLESPRDYGWNDVRRTSEVIMNPDIVRHFTHSMQAMAA